MLRVAFACLLWVVAIARAAAAPTAVDLELVLAVDVSGSVNQARFELQREGYAAAFRNPRVLDAIAAGAERRIAVAMVQWTGPSLHVRVVDWTLVDGPAAANALADAVAATPRALFGGGTSLSGAIDNALVIFAASPYRGTRRVIDISGDGSNNRGRPAAQARDEAVAAGVTINGLPIVTLEPDLETWYRENVIGGAGSFVVAVDNYDAFADAILNKLINEIAATGGPRRSIAAR